MMEHYVQRKPKKYNGLLNKSPRIMVLGDIDLDENEEKQLESVIRRYDEARLNEEFRLKKIRRSLFKELLSTESENIDHLDHCNICGSYMMFLLSREKCSSCNRQICRKCSKKIINVSGVLCKACHSESQLRAMTGLWFSQIRRDKNSQARPVAHYGAEALRASMIRIKKTKYFAISTNDCSEIGSSGYDTINSADTPKDPVDLIRRPISRYPSDSSTISLHDKIISVNNHHSMSMPRLQTVEPTTKDYKLFNPDSSPSAISINSNFSCRSLRIMPNVTNDQPTELNQIAGDLLFSLDYVDNCIRLFVKEVRDIKNEDNINKEIKYCVITYLLPDRSNFSKRVINMKKGSRRGVFDEAICYVISKDEMAHRRLEISLWNKNSFTAGYCIGEILITPGDYLFSAKTQWNHLYRRNEIKFNAAGMEKNEGSISISIKYASKVNMKNVTDEDTGQFFITIKNANNLKCYTNSKTILHQEKRICPYVKVYLLPEKSKSSKRKSMVMQNSINPIWDATFSYNNIQKSKLSSYGVEITVWNAMKLYKNAFLGGCRLCNNSEGEQRFDATVIEESIWRTIINKPNIWVEACIMLRNNLI